MTLKKSRLAATGLLVAGALVGATGAARAQNTLQNALPGPAAPVNPLLEPARAAFESLPLEERKAIQDDLVWASTYRSTLDGGFGKGTFDAILAFETKTRAKADGILDGRERPALAAEAARLRKLVGFQTVADARSGARLGLPTRAIDQSTALPRGTQWSRKASHFVVTTDAHRPGEADLAALFESQKISTDPTRKVNYSVFRQTWFVVAGETQTRRFYIRYAADPGGAVTGYTLSADKTTPDLDLVTVAIANAFEPFPSGAAPAVAAAPGQAAPAPGPAAPPAPAQPQTVVASGLVVAPGRVVTVAKAAEACRALTARTRPARVVKVDAEAGLALLEAEGVVGGSFGLRASLPGVSDPLLVLASAERASVIVAAGAAVAAPPHARSAFRVLTPLQPGGMGATVTDRSGAVAALVVGPVAEPRRIAGVVPEAAQEAVPAEAVARFLTGAGILIPAAPAGGTRTAGEVATAMKSSITQVVCQR